MLSIKFTSKIMSNKPLWETTPSILSTKSQSLVGLALERAHLSEEFTMTSLPKDSEYSWFLKFPLLWCKLVAWFWWPSSTFRKESNSKVCWSASKCMLKITLLVWLKWANHPQLFSAIEELLTLLLTSPRKSSKLLWTRKDGAGSPSEIEDMTESSSLTLQPVEPKNSTLLRTTRREVKAWSSLENSIRKH